MIRTQAHILSPGDLNPAVEALRKGDVLAIPTETVYGLAGNAFDATAVIKIFSAKERPSFDPLIVHVGSHLKTLSNLASEGIVDSKSISHGMAETFEALAKAFWPGPLTMILPKHENIPYVVTSGLPRVGIRMPAHPVAQKILEQTGLPLAAPSANRFGRISPTTPEHVMEELGDRISYIVDGGPCDIGVESTVIALDEDKVWLLRPGKISIPELKAKIHVPVDIAPSGHEKSSPGMLASHYAPIKPMYIVSSLDHLQRVLNGRSFDLMIISGTEEQAQKRLATDGLNPVSVSYLSKNHNPEEIAKKLFGTMRNLDRSPGEVLITLRPDREDGLWAAINDRILRASTKT